MCMKEAETWRITSCRNNKNTMHERCRDMKDHEIQKQQERILVCITPLSCIQNIAILHSFGFKNYTWTGTDNENQQKLLPMPSRIMDPQPFFFFLSQARSFAMTNYVCQPNNMNVSIRNIPFRKGIRIIGGEPVRIHAIYTCMWIDNIFCTTKMLLVRCSGTYNWWNSTADVNGAT